MERIYHPYNVWEDYKNGMWRKETPENEKKLLDKAIDFMGNHEEYGAWMMRVIKEWPLTCQHNLTDTTQNRKAFIGHCACCLAFCCPEYITRDAWGYLTKKQQDDANRQAEKAIALWEKENDVYEGDYAKELFEL